MSFSTWKKTKVAATVLLGLTISSCGSDSSSSEESLTISGATYAIDTGSRSLSGDVTLSDAKAFVAQTDTKTKYGVFSISEAGSWTFKVSPTASLIAATAEQTFTEDIKIFTAGGQEFSITVETQGKDDMPVIESGEGKDTATLDYSNAQQVRGTLPISDPDAEQSLFKKETALQGYFGKLSIAEDGQWQYHLYSDTVKELSSTPHSTYSRTDNTTVETFTVSSVDGTKHDISVVIDNHLQYQQTVSLERFAFDHSREGYNINDLLDTTKLKAILASHTLSPVELYEYNDDGDITLSQKFDSAGEEVLTKSYDYSVQNDVFTRIYTTSQPVGTSGTSFKVTKETREWDLTAGKLDSFSTLRGEVEADGELTETSLYSREFTYTAEGKVDTISRQKLDLNSKEGLNTAYLLFDFDYNANGDRESYSSYLSTGDLRSVYEYELGLHTKKISYDTDGVPTLSYIQDYKDGKIAKRVQYNGQLPVYVNFYYYDDFGRRDRVAQVNYLDSGEMDRDQGIQITQYIYNNGLNLRLAYHYKKDLNTSTISWRINSADGTGTSIYVSRFKALECGTERQLNHKVWATKAATEACPAVTPFPSTKAVESKAVAFSATLSDLDSLSFD